MTENSETLLKKQKNKKGILSWAFYDWANSAFATTIMAGFFPVFFKSYWADPTNPTLSTYYLGTANSIASIIVAIMAPFLGAMADKMAGKKKFLFFFASLGIIMSISLSILAQGAWQLAALTYVLGTVGFSSANSFYDSLLPSVAPEEKIDYVSSLGFSLGYIGGGLLFLVNVIMFLSPSLFGLPDEIAAVKMSFLSVGLWWAIFSIPLFLWVKEPKQEETFTFIQSINTGWLQLKETFSDIKKLKWVGIFLLGYWFYIDGVDTIIRMAVDYGVALGFPSSSLIVALLLTQFVAFPGTLIFNKYAEKVGIKKGVLTAIAAYIIIDIFGYFMNEVWHFYALASMIGMFQGGIQALSRSLYSRLIPENKAAQFYGFFNMLGKFAAVIGPFLVGIVTLLTGNNRLGILSIIVLFLIGGVILYFVDFEEGHKMAVDYLK